MSKYCYVGLANFLKYDLKLPVELQREVEHEYGPSPFKVKNVLYYYNYGIKCSFPVICEEFDDYFVDMVTGEKYEKCSNRRDVLDNCLYFYELVPVSMHTVATELKKLSKPDIKRYKCGINSLKQFVAENYRDEVNKPAIMQKQTEDDVDFIKRFIKKYH